MCIRDRLKTQGSLPVDFYPSFADDDNPASGFVETAYTPRFSSGYFPLRNRLVMLIETHSWKTYPERVRSTYKAVLDTLELVAQHGIQWRQWEQAADTRPAQLAGTPVPLDYKTTENNRIINFLGSA